MISALPVLVFGIKTLLFGALSWLFIKSTDGQLRIRFIYLFLALTFGSLTLALWQFLVLFIPREVLFMFVGIPTVAAQIWLMIYLHKTFRKG